MRTILTILIIAALTYPDQNKTITIQKLKDDFKLQALDMADRYSDIVNYALQEENQAKLFADSLHMLRDSLKTAKDKK